jgi:drug/metabolite transporter (DMT)-like permease
VSRKVNADLSLVVCTLIWGASFVIVKSALADASVFAFLAIRFAVAALVLAAFCARELGKLNASSVRAGAVMGCCMFGGYAFQTAGIQLTTPSKAAFVTGFSVVLVPVFLGIFARRRIGPWIWAGIAMALGGLYYLTVPSSGFGNLNRGDVLVLCGSVAFAWHIIAIGRYARVHSATVLNFLQVTMTLLMIVVTAAVLRAGGRESLRVVWTTRLIGGVLLTGVLATAVTFAVQLWAQQSTSPTHAAILFTSEPVFAALISFAFFHERLGRRGLAGAGLILAGILLAEFKGPAPSATEQS